MTHYFTNDFEKSNIKKTSCTINNEQFTFYTDLGVFSKSGLDFGTKVLLESLDLDKIKGGVLDFGCGYGPIGIYINKMTDASVDMIDVNNRATELAKKNAAQNQVNVNIFSSNIYENVTKKYDFIITNPPIRVGNETLYKILIGAKEHLKDGGELWFVINKNQGAKTVMKNLEKYYNVRIVDKSKGFYVFCATNN